MRALLLAAGLGTRLRPLTNSLPKCLVTVQGKTLLSYWFDLLFEAGIERVLVNTHYLPEVVREFVKNSPYSNQVDLVHEDILLGTGGTILANKQWFKGEDFLVAHADNLTVFNAQEFIEKHTIRPSQCAITMMTFDTDSPKTCGIIEEKNGVVIAFHEKLPNPIGNLANAAVYIFETSVINFIESQNKSIIDLSTMVIPEYIGRIFTYHNKNYHRDIGSIESLTKAEKEFRFIKGLFDEK